jgi:uncharacterized protein (DUF58 family)
VAMLSPRRLTEHARNKFRQWALWRLRGPEAAPIFLAQRRVFILPTSHGLWYGGALFALLGASVQYNLNLGFILTFLLAGVGLLGIVHTFRNLAHLYVSPGRVDPVFAGEPARFTVLLDNRSRYDRFAIGAQSGSGAPVYCDAPKTAIASSVVAIIAARRGWFYPGRITLSTRFPLGLLRAWSYVELDRPCLVYPRPERTPLPQEAINSEYGERAAAARGTDDFSGLRAHQLSDSPRHVAWKAVARGADMLTKQFAGRADARLWLDWSMLPPALDVEARLSRLTGWVLDAETQGLSYGLRLPTLRIAPAHGDVHCSACLKALALYGSSS